MPFATVAEEKPWPSPVAVQATYGPHAGHCFSSPVSGNTPSPAGPRNRGQSTPPPRATKVITMMNEEIIVILFTGCLLFGDQYTARVIL